MLLQSELLSYNVRHFPCAVPIEFPHRENVGMKQPQHDVGVEMLTFPEVPKIRGSRKGGNLHSP